MLYKLFLISACDDWSCKAKRDGSQSVTESAKDNRMAGGVEASQRFYTLLSIVNGSSLVHWLRLKSLNGKSECRTTRGAIHVHRVAWHFCIYIYSVSHSQLMMLYNTFL